MRNYWIVAACAWLLILAWIMVLVSDDISSRQLVCIASQSIDMDGTLDLAPEECMWVTPAKGLRS